MSTHPSKPPDIAPNVLAQPSPVIPNQNTIPLHQNSSPTLPICLQSAATLCFSPSVAAAPINGGLVTGQSPFEVPHIAVHIDGSDAFQHLEPAHLTSGQTRATLPAPSSPLDTFSSPPISEAPCSA
ncbi:hypothetical protein Adt_11950 [Abeliophyllum distichum]|uniref:Uncharacterized protein n=1 Tax=Abeliophyllum distichum TaxID=126358 RepID=A0ABD1UPK3_9LAMI